MSEANGIPPNGKEKRECGHCGVQASSICKGCQNIKYCSKEHQIADWYIHKLLCRTFASFQERPGYGISRAISFPEDSERPCFIWIPTVSEEVSLIEDEETDESLSRSGSVQDEALSIFEHVQYDAEEIGWDDARADPTGYELPDTNLSEDGSDTSFSTATTSVEEEGKPAEGLRLLLRRASDLPDEDRPNKCIRSMINDRAGLSFLGSWELYGVSRATKSGVDLDTTFLTLALLLISEKAVHQDCVENSKVIVAAEDASLAEHQGDLELDIQETRSDTSLVAPLLFLE